MTDGTLRSSPDIAVNAAGNVVITYERGVVGTEETLFARTYKPATHSVGAAVRNVLLDTDFDPQGDFGLLTSPQIVALGNGNFLSVVPIRNDADSIGGRILNGSGVPLGTAPVTFASSSTAQYLSSDAAALDQSGNFVVTWAQSVNGNMDIFFRIFSQSTTTSPIAVTGAIRANSTTANEQREPTVAELADGTFVIAWVDTFTDDVFGQRFNANGTRLGSEFEISSPFGPGRSLENPTIEAFDDGRFIVTWVKREIIPGSGGQERTTSQAAIFDPRDDANSPNVYTTDAVIETCGVDTIEVAPSDRELYGFEGDDRFVFGSQRRGWAGPSAGRRRQRYLRYQCRR